MTPKEINQRLLQDVLGVCEKLLPNGSQSNNEWRVGNIQGDEGKSLHVSLSGNRKGKWKDFRTDEGGDLVTLWMKRKNLTFVDTLKEIKAELGIKDESPFTQKSEKKFQKPEKRRMQPVNIDSNVGDWLCEERGLSSKSIDAYKVQVSGNNLVFPCFRDQEVKMYKYRKIRTRFYESSSDTEPSLFGWHVIAEDAREIIVTEGEFDCMSYFEQGIPALSVPFGGGGGEKQSWIQSDWETLERFDKIFLSMDMDDAGESAAQEIASRLGRHRCFRVKLPFKDANDCLVEGLQLQQYLDQAEMMSPEVLKNAASFHNKVMELFYPSDDFEYGMALPWRRADQLLRFREKEVTLWTGYNGHMKSCILGHVIGDGVIRQHYKACIASMEMPPERTLHRMYRQIGGTNVPTQLLGSLIRDEFNENLYVFDVVRTAKVEYILEAFQFAVQRLGVKQFIIDSLLKCGIGEKDLDSQKFFVEKLCDFVKEFNCHIHLVAHARKGEDEYQKPDKMDVRGSGSMTDQIDNLISIWKNKRKFEAIEKSGYTGVPVDEKILNQPDIRFKCSKQRNGEWEGLIGLTLNLSSLQFIPMDQDDPYIYISREALQEKNEN
jgi:twinkle protein